MYHMLGRSIALKNNFTFLLTIPPNGRNIETVVRQITTRASGIQGLRRQK